MSEYKGTKGKWIVYKNREEFAITTIDETQAICFMPVLHEQAEANAKLIAVAPEMLAFIAEMAKRYSNSEWISKEAKQLIKKATS